MRDALLFGSILIAVGLPIFETQLVMMFSAKVVPILLSLSLGLMLLSNLHNGRLQVRVNVPVYYVCWLLLCVIFSYGFIKREYIIVSKIYFFVVFAFFIYKTQNWWNFFWKTMVALSALSVISTYFFYFFSNAYAVMVDFYGYYPGGTGKLIYGYRAGISGHYSHNTIMIAVFIIMLVCKLLSMQESKDRARKRAVCWIAIVFAIIALLMTGKRGTTVWCAVAVLFTVFVNCRNKSRRLAKAILLVVVLVFVLQLASLVIPEVESIIMRVALIGKDVGSLERIAMWSLALNGFLKAPILGIGFTNFRDLYSNELAHLFHDGEELIRFQRLDAHNVYVQVFCETGVVGGIIYLAAVTLLLLQTIRLVRYFSGTDKQVCRLGALCSLCLQVFYLTYSLSGNCLYDCVFYFYGMAMALTMSLSYAKKESKQRNDLCEKNRNPDISQCM